MCELLARCRLNIGGFRQRSRRIGQVNGLGVIDLSDAR